MRLEVKWTADEDTRLTALHAQTDPFLSFREIAIAIGRGEKGRSACIGRAHRIGLPDRSDWLSNKQNERAKRRPPKLWLVKKQGRPMPIFVPGGGTPPTIWKELWEMEPGECHWPYGDQNFVFCALPTDDGASFCPCHFRKAYQPARRQAA